MINLELHVARNEGIIAAHKLIAKHQPVEGITPEHVHFAVGVLRFSLRYLVVLSGNDEKLRKLLRELVEEVLNEGHK